MPDEGSNARSAWPATAASGVLFWAAVLIEVAQILPIWLIHYFPTQDGPSHLANAAVLAGYGQHALYREYFRLSLLPVPNWFSHASLAVLLHVVPPVAAEKLLVTLYVVLFPLAIFYFLAAVRGRPAPLLGLLGFVFMFNYLLYKGFYNFSFSVPFYFFSVGYWWKHRSQLGAREAVTLGALLLLTYFCHLVGFVLAVATIALLALPALRRSGWRQRLALVLALAPSLGLTVWYLSGRPLGLGARWSVGRLYDYLIHMRSLVSYDAGRPVPELLMWLLLALFLYTVVERLNLAGGRPAHRRGELRLRRTDAFYAVFALVLVIYFVAPDGMSGGGFLSPRLSLFPFLVLLPALSEPRRGPLRAAFGVAIVAITAIQLGLNVRYDRTLSGDLDDYTSGMSAVEPGRTFVSLSFHDTGSLAGNHIGVFEHAIGYYAARTAGVDLEDYEGDTNYFPVRFNPALRLGIDRPDPDVLRTRPDAFDPARYVDRVDYVVTWYMPPDAAVASRIRRLYHEIYASASGRLHIFARDRGDAPVTSGERMGSPELAGPR